jgi:hypothetical protein
MPLETILNSLYFFTQNDMQMAFFWRAPKFSFKIHWKYAVGAKFKSGRDFFRVLITVIGTKYSLVQQWAGQPGFNSWQWQEIFLYSKMSKLALEPTLTSVQWVPRAVSPELSTWGVKTDHSTRLVPIL